jgi:hypothetical protein
MATVSLVSLTALQTTPTNPYSTGMCNCFVCAAQPTTCPNGDWQYGTTSCCGGLCPPITLCSQLDSSVCPTIANGPSKITWQTPNSTGSANAAVQCQYDPTKFQTTQDLQQWVSLQGQDSQFQTQIMPTFCSGTSTTCPNNWLTNTPMPKCSRLLSTGDDGTICRQWQQQNPALADAVMVQYCGNSSNQFGCDCLRRQQTPGYNLVAPNFTTSDACWYRPCQATSQELVTSNLLNPVCPATTCQDAGNITPAQQQVISQNFISCPLNKSPVQSVAQTLGINIPGVARSLGIPANAPITRNPLVRRIGLQQTPITGGWQWLIAVLIIVVVIILLLAVFMQS